MSSKRRIRRKSCTNKVGMDTLKEALFMRWRLKQRDVRKLGYTQPMNVYKCRFCKKYHVGHGGKHA